MKETCEWCDQIANYRIRLEKDESYKRFACALGAHMNKTEALVALDRPNEPVVLTYREYGYTTTAYVESPVPVKQESCALCGKVATYRFSSKHHMHQVNFSCSHNDHRQYVGTALRHDYGELQVQYNKSGFDK